MDAFRFGPVQRGITERKHLSSRVPARATRPRPADKPNPQSGILSALDHRITQPERGARAGRRACPPAAAAYLARLSSKVHSTRTPARNSFALALRRRDLSARRFARAAGRTAARPFSPGIRAGAPALVRAVERVRGRRMPPRRQTFPDRRGRAVELRVTAPLATAAVVRATFAITCRSASEKAGQLRVHDQVERVFVCASWRSSSPRRGSARRPRARAAVPIQLEGGARASKIRFGERRDLMGCPDS